MKSFFSGRNFFSGIVSIVLSVVFVASITFASTTISSNVQTDGTLSVTGISTFNGQLQASSTALFTDSVTVYKGLTVGSGTTANAIDGTVLFKAQATAPSVGTQGGVYYDSVSKVLKLSDGTSWFTIGTTTSGISLTGARLQLGDLATQYLTLGTTTQQSSGQALLTLEATTTTSVPLVLVGYNNQTGNLFSIRNAGSTKLLYITSAGNLFATGTVQATGAVTAYSTLTVGGVASLGSSLGVTGAATFSSTLGVTGLTTLGFASTSALSLNGANANFMVNGMATTTYAGALSIQGKFGVGTSTAPSLEISADSSATTTIGAFSSGTKVGGCIQLEGANDVMYRIYATTTGPLIAEVGSCK